MSNPISKLLLTKIKAELQQLDSELVEIEGRKIKPSQCYRFGFNPAHILFNTNCPENIKQQVKAILDKYLQEYKSRME